MPGQTLVPLENLWQAFFLHQAKADLERVKEAYGWRPRGLAVLRRFFRGSPIEVEPGQLRTRLALPGPWRNRDERESRRDHPPLLRSRHDNIQVPRFRTNIYGPDRA